MGSPYLQRLSHWPQPSGTGSNCTGCCSKDTGMAGKNCCSRWSPQLNQMCSPGALCWSGKECLGSASVPLKRMENTADYKVVFKTQPLISSPTSDLQQAKQRTLEEVAAKKKADNLRDELKQITVCVCHPRDRQWAVCI